jgi:hypothetical protein
MRSRATFVVAVFVLLLPAALRSQETDSTRHVRAFIDCNVDGCDDDYFRREILFVDHMREPQDASVHVLVTAEPTGSGGTAYTLDFIGRRELAGLGDTLHTVVPQAATTDERRQKLVNFLKIGLLRYAARGRDAEQLTVSYTAPTAAATTKAATDRWNYWVFRTRANANLSGEKSQRFAYLSSSQSANRITRDWKTRLSLNQSYSENKFTFEGGGGFASYSHSFGLNELVVKSVTAHLSLGNTASLSASTFLNQKLAGRFAPAIEYDLFPYSESSRRQLTVLYSLGVSHFRYNDTTIFDKIAETRPDQALTLGLGLTQPWGSVGATLTSRSYLNDLSKNRLELFNSADVRLFKGLSLNLFISASRVRDQLYLAKGGATEQEVLLRRRQLATSFSYYSGFGLTYTFGSFFNNIVNTRFDGPNF